MKSEVRCHSGMSKFDSLSGVSSISTKQQLYDDQMMSSTIIPVAIHRQKKVDRKNDDGSVRACIFSSFHEKPCIIQGKNFDHGFYEFRLNSD